MGQIDIEDYNYLLPQEKIARYPLKQRDESRLLVWKDKEIGHHTFGDLSRFLPGNSFLFFNDTKVIPARLFFQKPSGATIEIFLLNPQSPSTLVQQAMETKGSCTWHCMIGNLKRWREGETLALIKDNLKLKALLKNRSEALVTFNWDDTVAFAEVITTFGSTPLPPYLNRAAEQSDRMTYQTIYSHHEGAVAAPTAGLHFTDQVFGELRTKSIGHDFLTLHVSAGTFQPIKVKDAVEHRMHNEQIIVHRRNLENLLAPDRFIIPVGTTSMRTLESIYWYGVKLLAGNTDFSIGQEYPYENNSNTPLADSCKAILRRMNELKTDVITGETSIFIRPGYQFRVCDALITNFHQPSSTLLLLVAAFIGPAWKDIYASALENNYRFLSYGDSSVLFRKSK